MQNNTQQQSNIWRTVVIVAVCMIATVFAWQFLTHSSSDLQALFVGIFAFGAPAGFAAGWIACRWQSPEPKQRMEELNAAYASGHSAGVYKGYHAAIARDSVVEVITPQQQRELVPVRR